MLNRVGCVGKATKQVIMSVQLVSHTYFPQPREVRNVVSFENQEENMAKKVLTALLVLTFAFASQPAALAQDKADSSPQPVQDWQGLRDLKPGKVIVVYTKQGKQFEGKFVDIKGSTLGLALGFNILDFEHGDIEEIHRKPRYKRKGRFIGALVGVVAGAMIAGSIGLKMEANQKGPPFPDSPAPLIIGVGAFGGGGLGYAIGLRFDNKRKGKLLYKSR
jgi:hypothetical protein